MYKPDGHHNMRCKGSQSMRSPWTHKLPAGFGWACSQHCGEKMSQETCIHSKRHIFNSKETCFTQQSHDRHEHVCSWQDLNELMVMLRRKMSKEICIHSKETYIYVKRDVFHSKESRSPFTCLQLAGFDWACGPRCEKKMSKETCIHPKETYIEFKRDLYKHPICEGACGLCCGKKMSKETCIHSKETYIEFNRDLYKHCICEGACGLCCGKKMSKETYIHTKETYIDLIHKIPI